MAPTHTLAIITRRQDYWDSSRLVQMITREYGRLTFLAKGAHRPKSPFLGAIDLLHVVDARVGVRDGRGLQNLYGLRVLQGNLRFRRDELRRSLALRATELCRLAMPEGRPDPELFDVLRGALTLFARSTTRCLPTIDTGILLRILTTLGLLASLDNCPESGEPLPTRGFVGFDPNRGGFVLARDGRRRVSAQLPQLATRLLAIDGRTLMGTEAPAGSVRELHALVDELLCWHLGDRPRSAVPESLFASPPPARRIQA